MPSVRQRSAASRRTPRGRRLGRAIWDPIDRPLRTATAGCASMSLTPTRAAASPRRAAPLPAPATTRSPPTSLSVPPPSGSVASLRPASPPPPSASAWPKSAAIRASKGCWSRSRAGPASPPRLGGWRIDLAAQYFGGEEMRRQLERRRDLRRPVTPVRGGGNGSRTVEQGRTHTALLPRDPSVIFDADLPAPWGQAQHGAHSQGDADTREGEQHPDLKPSEPIPDRAFDQIGVRHEGRNR